MLVVRESHSNLCTGRGYIIYSNASAAAKALSQLNGSEFLGDASNKFSLEAVDSKYVAEITTLKGQARINELNLSSIVGTGTDLVDQLANKLSHLPVGDIDRLVQKISTRGAGTINRPVVTPRLPSFSGRREKSETGYDHWRSQFKSLLADSSYSDSQVLYAVHQSVKDTAGDVLLSMPDGSTSSDVLTRFDSYFGNVLPIDSLTQNFHSSKQEANETVVSWSCRLQRMLDLMNKKDPMTRSTYDRLHRSKFWNGLYAKDIKEATRHRFENGEDFEEIFAASRALESEARLDKVNPNTKKSAPLAHQIVSTEASDQSRKLDKVLQRLSTIGDRLVKLESQKLSKPPKYRGEKGNSEASKNSSSDSIYCTRCKRKSHSVDTCHAKIDKYGKPLKN